MHSLPHSTLTHITTQHHRQFASCWLHPPTKISLSHYSPWSMGHSPLFSCPFIGIGQSLSVAEHPGTEDKMFAYEGDLIGMQGYLVKLVDD